MRYPSKYCSMKITIEKAFKKPCVTVVSLVLVTLTIVLDTENCSAQDVEPKPNIVLIMVDDLGWTDLGFMGGNGYETPGVDQLASEGITYSKFYAAGPVCSPTRASILTGKNPARTGISTYLITPEKDPEHVTHELQLSEFTLAEALKKNHYVTGLFGKWHLGYQQEHWASNQGFDQAIGGTTSQNAWNLLKPGIEPPLPQYEVSYFSPYHLTHMENGPKGEYITDRLTDETIKFIRGNKENQFFAFLSFHTVHTPLEAKPETIEKYRKKFEQLGVLDNKDMENGSRKYQNLPEYAAMVEHMDQNVSRLLQEIEDLGLRENTIVVFTSDNGGKGNVTSNLPLRGAKHSLYEGGIRVPLIIRYPSKIKAGQKSEVLISSDDLYPTLLEMAGLPLESFQHQDGRSFKKTAFKLSEKPVHKALFWHYPHNRFEAAVRWKNYKLIYEYGTGMSELYDLSQDLSESHNLANDAPKVVDKLKRYLAKWLDQTGARFPDEGMIMPTSNH